MQFLKTLVFLVFVFVSFQVCRITNSQKPLNDAKPILEITQDAKGMWEIEGKTLFMRLYDNGNIEYEFPDEKKMKQGINRTKDLNVLKKANLNGEKFQKLVNLLKSDDFRNLENTYQRKCCCTDATLDFEIKIQTDNQSKNINLANYCGINELTNPRSDYAPDFPKQLSELFALTDNLRYSYF